MKKEITAATTTSEIRMNRCSMCGAILETETAQVLGYISPSRLSAHQEEGICDRCYKLRHYNAADDKGFDADYIKILKKANSEEALVVYVIDLFALEASLIDNIGQYLGNNVLLVMNKRDVLPKSVDDKKLASSILSRLKADHIVPKEALITSSAQNLNLERLNQSIGQLRNGKNVYFIGASQVGKSSIINAILRNYKNDTGRVISTYQVTGTQLDIMEIPLDATSSLYDTPGIFNPKSLLNQVERAILKYLIPREEICPRTYMSAAGQSFILGAIAELDFVSGPKTSFEFSLSNQISITRTKLEKAVKTFDTLAQTSQVRPTSQIIKSSAALETNEVTIPASGHVAVYILGLVCIRFEGASQKILLKVPPHVGVKVLIEE